MFVHHPLKVGYLHLSVPVRSIGDWFNERGILLEDRLFEDLQEMQDYCKHKKRQ